MGNVVTNTEGHFIMIKEVKQHVYITTTNIYEAKTDRIQEKPGF